jgi:hypothetical protein
MPKKRRDKNSELIGDPQPLIVPLPLVELETEQPADDAVGLQCPQCGCRHFEVVYTRPKLRRIQRCRECRHCGRRITTNEVAAFDAGTLPTRSTGVTNWQTLPD